MDYIQRTENKQQSFPSGLSQIDAYMVPDEISAGHVINSTEEHESPRTISDEPMLRASSADEEHMRIVSGFIGYTQNQLTYCLEPVVGWFVMANDEMAMLTEVGQGDQMSSLSENSHISQPFDAMLDYRGG